MQLHFKKSATACNYSFIPSWNFPNATAALQIAVKTALLGGFKQTEHNYLQHAKKTDDCSGSTVWSSVHTPTICVKSEDQRQFASQPRPAQWQFLDRMSKCDFDSLWRTVLRLRYGKSFSIFLNLKSSYHLSFCNSGGDSRAVLCAGLNSPLQRHPNKAGYTTITTQGYAFLKQHLCISL